MAASDFIWIPQEVIPSPPVMNIDSTESESFKMDYNEFDSNIKYFYTLKFGKIKRTGATLNRQDIYDHFVARKGNFEAFSWTTVPSWISATPIDVRYSDYQEEPFANGNVWEVSMTFRKEPD
ncbi:MAG: hypothetical protein KKD77_23585 [Gammaproteobacteria bacterium]|nr:hypothetical protein [Gammaproteobacteria bacterium]